MKIGISTALTKLAGVSTVPPVGDTFANNEAMFGFNKLRTAYTGSALKVERSSDGTTQDIGFDATGMFDAAALTAFVGGGTARLHTWYDQSGNGYDCTQTTDALQPVLQQDSNGYWYVYLNGTDFVQQATFLGAPPSTVYGYALWQWPANGIVSGNSAAVTFANTDINGFITTGWTTEPAGYYYGTNVGSLFRAQNRSNTDGKPRMFGWLDQSDEVTLYDGPEIALPTETVDSLEYERIKIGANAFANCNTRIYELVVTSAANSNDDAWAWVKQTYPLMWAKQDLFVVLGDSQTSALFPGTYNCWVTDWMVNDFIENVQVFQKGGYRLQDWIDNFEQISGTLSELTITGTTRAIVWLGTNDMETDGLTGAQAFAKYETLRDLLLNAGVDEVYAMTAMPRGGDTSIVEPELSYNAALKADLNTTDVIELDGNANLTNSTNTTYFNVDTVHLTASGHDQVAAEVSAVGTLNGW